MELSVYAKWIRFLFTPVLSIFLVLLVSVHQLVRDSNPFTVLVITDASGWVFCLAFLKMTIFFVCVQIILSFSALNSVSLLLFKILDDFRAFVVAPGLTEREIRLYLVSKKSKILENDSNLFCKRRYALLCLLSPRYNFFSQNSVLNRVKRKILMILRELRVL
jgi:hypothetical protein